MTRQDILNGIIAAWDAKQNIALKQTTTFSAFLRGSDQRFAKEVIEYAMKLDFWQASKSRIDENAWNTLVPDLALIGSIASDDPTVFQTAIATISNKEFKVKAAFVMHMLEAFENGDRFIVAKLAYDGSNDING